jgi:hypothetical protein
MCRSAPDPAFARYSLFPRVSTLSEASAVKEKVKKEKEPVVAAAAARPEEEDLSALRYQLCTVESCFSEPTPFYPTVSPAVLALIEANDLDAAADWGIKPHPSLTQVVSVLSNRPPTTHKDACDQFAYM